LFFLFLFVLLIVVSIVLLLYGVKSVPWNYTQFDFIDPKASNSKTPFPLPTERPTVYLTVVVPAYKEENRLDNMMQETTDYCKKRASTDPSFTYEIVIVDDGSPDGTTKSALVWTTKYGADLVRVLTLPRNEGKGGALRAGMLAGRGRYLLMCDADGATKFSDLERLERSMTQIESNGFGICCGSRSQMFEEAAAERAWYRNIVGNTFHFLVKSLCVKGIMDTQCGFKLFTRQSAQRLFSNLHIIRWAFDVELLYVAQLLRMPISEIPVTWTEIEGSHLSVVSASLQMAKDLIRIRLLYLLGLWKLK